MAASPRVERDGFGSVSDAPAAWDDRTASLGLKDVRYAVAPEGIAMARSVISTSMANTVSCSE